MDIIKIINYTFIIYMDKIKSNINILNKYTKKDFENLEEVLIMNGGTSTVYKMKDKEENYFIKKHMSNEIKKYNKIIKKVDIDLNFNKEIKHLNQLSKYDHFPYLFDYDMEQKQIFMSYCGENINNKNIPKNWKEQFIEIFNILNYNSIYHNDIGLNNCSVLDGVIYLFDLGEASDKIDYPYFNLSIKSINNSTSITNLFGNIREIGLGVIACLYERNKKNIDKIINKK